ncbi:MAG: 2-hydroxychromene-2-carboxylate isomerase [Cytophagales bacterium]|nr:2-hydroxychromene-2-carboxylate isomerase [Cytophagales bacterium]
MKHITFYYDPISPYAYLAFEQLPKALEGLSYRVTYTPILFAGLLKTYGQLGPAEIAPKRDWTYRQVLWQAKALGIHFQMPSQHPFNPLPLLRLSVACADENGHTNRLITQQIFHHVWRGGADAADGARLDALTKTLEGNIQCDTQTAKERLKANTDAALQAGIFGVPSLLVGEGADQKVFWGLDSLPMLRDCLAGDAWFDAADGWRAAAKVGVGIKRNESIILARQHPRAGG